MELQGEDVETLKQDSQEEPQGIETNINGAENEDEGISEAVARWERRKQERLLQQQSTPLSLQPSNDQIQKQQQDDDNNNNNDVAHKYGFIAEGCEFERYGKKAHNTSKWEWRIGRDNEEDESIRTTAKPRTKRRKEGDDDDWSGDSDGGKDVRKTPVLPRKKNVQTRSHESKRRKVVSETSSDAKIEGKTKQHSGVVATTSTTTTKKASKEDDDDDLDGFLVDDDEEETEVAEEEDEWTDEEEEEDEEEIDEEEEDPVNGDDRPLCKYGNNCFRKNKDHLTQFRH